MARRVTSSAPVEMTKPAAALVFEKHAMMTVPDLLEACRTPRDPAEVACTMIRPLTSMFIRSAGELPVSNPGRITPPRSPARIQPGFRAFRALASSTDPAGTTARAPPARAWHAKVPALNTSITTHRPATESAPCRRERRFTAGALVRPLIPGRIRSALRQRRTARASRPGFNTVSDTRPPDGAGITAPEVTGPPVPPVSRSAEQPRLRGRIRARNRRSGRPCRLRRMSGCR